MGWIDDITRSMGRGTGGSYSQNASNKLGGIGLVGSAIGNYFGDGAKELGRGIGDIGNTIGSEVTNRAGEFSRFMAGRQPEKESGFGGSGGSFGTPEPRTSNGDWFARPTGGESSMGEGMSDREKAYLEAIAAIRSKTEEQYSYDGANDGLVDEAFRGSFDAINNARTSTNSNYEQSKGMLDNLTNSHVANIKGADRNEINAIGDELSGSYDKIYNDRTSELTADRSAELAAKTEMLQRLGIQDSGLQGAGDVQTAAITDNIDEKQNANQQASAYRAADLTRNTELGQNQAAAGVERQSDLRRQLDSIMGNLDNSEAKVRNDVSAAKLQGRNADRASWDESQKYNNDTLIKLTQGETDQANVESDRVFQRELSWLKSQAQSKGSSNVFDAVGQRVSAKGYDPNAYKSAYTNAMVKGGGALSSVGGDKASYIIQQMLRDTKLDPNTVTDYVYGILEYGTDKLNATAQY